MVQSLNTKVDLTVNATSFMGLANYGKIMVGDKAFRIILGIQELRYPRRHRSSENMNGPLAFGIKPVGWNLKLVFPELTSAKENPDLQYKS